MYAVTEIDTKGNYRGTIEKANVLVTAFGTNLKYIENQMTYLNELEEKYGQRKTYWSNYINSVKNQLIENIKKL